MSSSTGYGATPTAHPHSATASTPTSATTSKRPSSPSLLKSEGPLASQHTGGGTESGEERPGKKSKGTPGPKARIPAEAKVIIAVEIINRGIAALNIDELVLATGLSKQQIKSQLVDNRQNVRRQLIELARGLQ